MELNNILAKLNGVKPLSGGGYTAKCPGHEDKHSSLSLSESDGKILLHCFAGCTTDSIVESMGLKVSDLFQDKKTTAAAPTIVATYDYLNENAELLYQVVRYHPKSFKQRHKNGNGEWAWNMSGVKRVIYHLDEIIKAIGTIYLVEGERDADNLWSWGLVATTSPGGASAWKPEYAEPLAGKSVVIIPDKDEAGFEYARKVAQSLSGKASLRCIILDKVKDISDWLDAGGDVSQFPSMEQDISALFNAGKPNYKLENDIVSWHKSVGTDEIIFKAESMRQERTGIHSRISVFKDFSPLAWSLMNIERSEERTRLANSAHGQLKDGTKKIYTKEALRSDLDNFCIGLWEFNVSASMPEFLAGSDTQEPTEFVLSPFIVDGGGTILFGLPGKGKSFSVLLWTVAVDAGVDKFWKVKKTPVLFINLERSGSSIQRRLASVNRILGLPANRKLLTLNARGKSLNEVIPICKKAIKNHGVGLVVLDSISRAGYGDLTENKSVNSIIDGLSGLCETWVALAHSPRGDETHVFGGIHFDAGADVVVRLVSETAIDGTLGVGWEIVKTNDLPKYPQSIWALEFNENGLSDFRKANSNEFFEVQGKSNKSMIEIVSEWLLDKGEATATEIASDLGYSRQNISALLTSSDRFIKTQKEGRNQFYGVKSYD